MIDTQTFVCYPRKKLEFLPGSVVCELHQKYCKFPIPVISGQVDVQAAEGRLWV
jgi:hypothetical protein